jgi:hypothetical protein
MNVAATRTVRRPATRFRHPDRALSPGHVITALEHQGDGAVARFTRDLRGAPGPRVVLVVVLMVVAYRQPATSPSVLALSPVRGSWGHAGDGRLVTLET